MRIDLHVHIDGSLTIAESNTLGEILTQITSIKETMSPQLQTLTDQVKANTAVIESAKTFIKGLADQLVAAKDDPAAIQALAEELKSEDATLSDAIATQPGGTPATPPVA